MWNIKITIAEVADQLRKKTQDVPGSFLKLGPNSEYGLFLPKEPGSKGGVWLDPDHLLEDYMQEENVSFCRNLVGFRFLWNICFDVLATW